MSVNSLIEFEAALVSLNNEFHPFSDNCLTLNIAFYLKSSNLFEMYKELDLKINKLFNDCKRRFQFLKWYQNTIINLDTQYKIPFVLKIIYNNNMTIFSDNYMHIKHISGIIKKAINDAKCISKNSIDIQKVERT